MICKKLILIGISHLLNVVLNVDDHAFLVCLGSFINYCSSQFKYKKTLELIGELFLIYISRIYYIDLYTISYIDRYIRSYMLYIIYMHACMVTYRSMRSNLIDRRISHNESHRPNFPKCHSSLSSFGNPYVLTSGYDRTSYES